ncbi:MAG: hypothetical protein HY842_07645 [Bacteroidetes bacterium]|nr:hypothetical protein [Bacteroidota bacterium]
MAVIAGFKGSEGRELGNKWTANSHNFAGTTSVLQPFIDNIFKNNSLKKQH